MTWIIGFPSFTGYAAAIADIQVTFTDRSGKERHVDGLQKIYPVGRWLLVGFCGDVELGFRLVDDLRAWLRSPDTEPNRAWIPDFVLQKWRRRARRIYAAFPSAHPRGSSLVLVGTHPTRNTGLGDSPEVSASILRAPEYHAEPIAIGTVRSIGSGNNVEVYRDSINRLDADPTALPWGDVMMSPGGSAQLLGHLISLDVANTPTPGVSKHFLTGMVRRGSIMIAPSDYELIHPGGRREQIRAPRCVGDWPSLLALIRRAGAQGSHQSATA